MSEKDNYNKLQNYFNDEYHMLKNYVNSKLDDTRDQSAEDVLQDVALKLFSRADSLSPISNVAGFVFRAIKNRIIDSMRTKKKSNSIDDENELKLNELVSLFYDDNEGYSEKMKHDLMRTIYQLKPHYREIILAVDFEGYSYREISEATGIPQGTLLSRRHRALSILYKELKKSN